RRPPPARAPSWDEPMQAHGRATLTRRSPIRRSGPRGGRADLASARAQRSLPKSPARTVADLGVRRRAARRDADPPRHRPARPRRLRAGAGAARRGRPAAAAALRLAIQPVVAVPADAGRARRARDRAGAGGAGQAVVGDPEAVRLAARALARAGAGAGDAAPAR